MIIPADSSILDSPDSTFRLHKNNLGAPGIIYMCEPKIFLSLQNRKKFLWCTQ